MVWNFEDGLKITLFITLGMRLAEFQFFLMRVSRSGAILLVMKKKAALSDVVEHFDRFAPSYERVNHLLSLGLDVRWRARLMGAAGGRPLRILDLCAGTLACTREALRRFPDAKVTAVDACRAMLDTGLQKLDESGKRRLTAVCADVLEADFAPGSFDVAISSFGMRHLPEQKPVLEKVHDWLCPGGRLIVFDFFRPERAIARLFHGTAGRYILPAAGEWLGGFGPAYVNLHGTIERFLSRAEYEQLLRTNRFVIRRSEDLTFGIVSLISAEPV